MLTSRAVGITTLLSLLKIKIDMNIPRNFELRKGSAFL